MENNTITLYEYTLSAKTKEFVKKTHHAVIEKKQGQTMYRLGIGNSHQYRNWIRENDLGKMFKGKIFSLVENDEMYRLMMIHYYENRIEETKQKLKKEKKILKHLLSEFTVKIDR